MKLYRSIAIICLPMLCLMFSGMKKSDKKCKGKKETHTFSTPIVKKRRGMIPKTIDNFKHLVQAIVTNDLDNEENDGKSEQKFFALSFAAQSLLVGIIMGEAKKNLLTESNLNFFAQVMQENKINYQSVEPLQENLFWKLTQNASKIRAAQKAILIRFCNLCLPTSMTRSN